MSGFFKFPISAFIRHYDHFIMVFASHRQPVCLLLGLFRLACAFGMAQVGTLFLLLWRDWGGEFTGRHGIAAHRILESRRGKDEGQADRFGASVLQTYPGIRRDKDKTASVEIALLIAEPNMSIATVNQHDFILDQVSMRGYGRAGSKIHGTRDEML
jgi:hypothetical protein